MIKVRTLTYDKFFDTYTNVVIPEYQRAYRWDTGKVEELLEDLGEFFLPGKPNHNSNLDYYLGSILLYKNKAENHYEIIDGQQRITTLTLLQYTITGKLQANQNLSYNSHISFYNIKKVNNYLQARHKFLNQLNEHELFKRLKLTIIESDNEDNAFAFFDSQNNRGVSLAADDYLKAYHLRAVQSELMQAKLAQEWETVVFKSQDKNYETGLSFLFRKILYRSRQWRGREVIPENKDEILKTFQKQTYPSEENQYKLFVNNNNIKYNSVLINSDDTTTMVSYDNFSSNNGSNLPFSLRQPLYKGLNFFQYTHKYYAIHQLLFINKLNDNSSIKEVRAYYEAIYNNDMSIFLRHYMQLCMVLYYDMFGEEQLYKAIQYFDYFIGRVRIEKQSVKKETVYNLMKKDFTKNLLDVIAHAYFPEEIFKFIESLDYISSEYNKEQLKAGDGVRYAYKERVGNYFFSEVKSLNNRLLWIK
jgi:uncharacterized protein with ParB-like and HNH nuclease domain